MLGLLGMDAASVVMVRMRGVLGNWKFYSTPKKISIKD